MAPLLLALALVAVGGALAQESADPGNTLARLESAVEEAPDEAARLRALLDLIESLEARGESESARYDEALREARRLDPRNPRLLERSARLRARLGDYGGAILDYERALETLPPDEWRVRNAMLHELSGLYARAGRFDDQIRVDEELLALDPERRLETLERLAYAYEGLGQLRSARETLRSLMSEGSPDRRFDADLAWFEASLAARVDGAEEAIDALLRFAVVHSDHPKALPARRMAAEIALERGEARGARLMLEDLPPREEGNQEWEKARLVLARAHGALGESEAAIAALDAVIAHAMDPQVILDATNERFEITVEAGGIQRGLHFLAGLGSAGEGFARELAVSKLNAVFASAGESLAPTAEDAYYLAHLADRAGAREVFPPGLRIRAARLAESIGATERAIDHYSAISTDLGSEGREAREALVRLGVERVPLVRPAEARLLRSRYLASRGRHEDVVETLEALPKEGASLDPEATRRLARALMAGARDAPRAARLLADAGDGPGTLLLRADALAMAGEREASCALYRKVGRAALDDADRTWLDARLARCGAPPASGKEG